MCCVNTHRLGCAFKKTSLQTLPFKVLHKCINDTQFINTGPYRLQYRSGIAYRTNPVPHTMLAHYRLQCQPFTTRNNRHTATRIARIMFIRTYVDQTAVDCAVGGMIEVCSRVWISNLLYM